MLEAHLMIERPERHVPRSSCAAGADSVTVHAEATPHLAYAVGLIRERGAGAGVAINPGTPVGALAEVAGEIDLALCMTVNPGWGGQPFIAHSLDKLPRVRAIVGAAAAVEVDGGIDPDTAPGCRARRRERVRRRLGDLRRADPAAAYRRSPRSMRSPRSTARAAAVEQRQRSASSAVAPA